MGVLKHILFVFLIVLSSFGTDNNKGYNDGLVLSLDMKQIGGKIVVDNTSVNYCPAFGNSFCFKNASATFVAGSFDYVDCGNNSSLNFTDQCTISFWVKLTSTLGGVCKRTTASSGFSYNAVCNSDNKLYWQLSNNGTTVAYAVLATAYPTGKWIHLSAWYYGKGTGNGGRAKIFLNGVEATCNYSGTIPATLYQTTTNLLVNRFNPSTYGDCNMQFLRMHNRALTLQEIRQMYVDQYNRINQQQ